MSGKIRICPECGATICPSCNDLICPYCKTLLDEQNGKLKIETNRIGKNLKQTKEKLKKAIIHASLIFLIYL